MSNIQLVVFDIAGTTVCDKGDVAHSFILAFQEFGFTVPKEEVKKVMGFRKIDAIRRLLEKYAPANKDDQDLIDRIHERFISSMISFYRSESELRPLPHAEEVFSALKQKGMKIALNTGFTRAITDTILQRLQWNNGHGLIDEVICSDEVPEGRPFPYMIQQLMKRLQIASPVHVLKAGDTEVDVEEGRNAGCGVVVSVTTGAYSRAQLQQYHPDHIIDSLEELMPIIDNA